jgi:putative Mg2+ transporter-C (MgtC) family protein
MNWLDFMARILLSILLGFLIGLERQITGHNAGIRINILISLGSCLFLMFPIISGSDEVFRIASYIVSGVGFLCSGVIFKDGGTVRGLNTAATLWCTAAIGVLASSGNYLFATVATGTLILSNLLFRPLAIKMKPIIGWEESEKVYRISITCQEAMETEIRALLIGGNTCKTLYLNHLDSGDVVGDKVEVIAEYCSVGTPKNQVLEGIVLQALKLPDVVSAGWEVL